MQCFSRFIFAAGRHTWDERLRERSRQRGKRPEEHAHRERQEETVGEGRGSSANPSNLGSSPLGFT